MTALTWMFRRLAWALSRDDLKQAFYRAKVSALGFFLLIWLPVIALSILLPRTAQDMALLASFPATGTVFWLGLRHVTKDGPRQAEPRLDGATRRSLYRLIGSYLVVVTGIAAIVWQFA